MSTDQQQSAQAQAPAPAPAPCPLPTQRPRKNIWLQGQDPIIGLKRKKGDRNRANWRFEIDNKWLGHSFVHGHTEWNDLPRTRKNGEGDETSSSSSSSSGPASGRVKVSMWELFFKFW
ncbi:hypothetical protein LZ554_008909 [Drepanopeziza brunnea f. sp. 'monogermtubi']|nr:hypothetical protein LZ554_008909 [Drepanopeziza brunnea f. sp. 'monogermtubi']